MFKFSIELQQHIISHKRVVQVTMIDRRFLIAGSGLLNLYFGFFHKSRVDDDDDDDNDDSYEYLQEMNFVPYETLLHNNMNTNGFVVPFVMQQEHMNDCRSMGSNIHPSSQSRKISIGAMAEPKASSKSGPLRKGFIFVVLRIKKKYKVFVSFSTFSGGEIIGVGCILRVLFISRLRDYMSGLCYANSGGVTVNYFEWVQGVASLLNGMFGSVTGSAASVLQE